MPGSTRLRKQLRTDVRAFLKISTGSSVLFPFIFTSIIAAPVLIVSEILLFVLGIRICHANAQVYPFAFNSRYAVQIRQ